MTKDTAPTGLALLRAPFPAHQISKLPKPKSKDAVKGHCNVCGGWHGLPAVHLDYVGHAALTDRLLDADASWTWEPMAIGQDGLPKFDDAGGLWIRLTVCSVTRMGYGNAEKKSYADVGAREKEVIGDALRNAAMRFGAALDLWHKGYLHREDDPAIDADESILTALRDASMEGLAALKAAYDKHQPSDALWKTHAHALKLAAQKAEQSQREGATA